MKVCVYTFRLSDSDDPEIYAAEPLYNWQQTEQGQWVMQHSKTKPYWHIDVDHTVYGYRCRIFAELADKDLTYFNLKFRNFE